MNIKVTIEVNGPPAEVARWLAQLPTGAGASASPESWTSDLADRLVRRISDKARQALGYMAEEAPTIRFEDLQDRMGLTGVKIGGVLASVGFAERAGIPRPYTADYDAREYHMDPGVAEIIANAIEEYEATTR